MMVIILLFLVPKDNILRCHHHKKLQISEASNNIVYSYGTNVIQLIISESTDASYNDGKSHPN